MLTLVGSAGGRVARIVKTGLYFSPARVKGAIAILASVLGAVSIAACPQAASAQTSLTPDQRAIIDKIAKPRGRGELQYSGAPTDDVGATVQLPVGGKYITLVRKDSNLQKDGSVVWYGEVQETGERAMLMLWSNALLTGYFAYNGTIYTVESLGGGVNAFSEMERRQIPAEHPEPSGRVDSTAVVPAPQPIPQTAIVEPKVEPFSDATRIALEAKDITIDVMLLYSRNVAELYIRKPEDLLALAIEETNQTFRNSGLGNIKLRLVHTQLVDYDGSEDDQFTHLYTMVDGLGPFEDVKKLRDEKRADIVGLIINNSTGCGLSTRIGPTSDEAFFVVHHACAAVTMSIAHEIGHMLGVRHDRFVDQTDEPFAYGHGYVNGSKWRDIMSYKAGCGGCPRIPYWSNPRVLYKGQPTGTPASDSARVILELAERVSKFR
jgi:Metallo-peptidase family M12